MKGPVPEELWRDSGPLRLLLIERPPSPRTSPPMLERLEAKLDSPGVGLFSVRSRRESAEEDASSDACEFEKRILPFSRSPPSRDAPLNVRNAALSLAFFSATVVGRTGEGDVARYSIRSAASLSSAPAEGRGVSCEPCGDGVCLRRS